MIPFSIKFGISSKLLIRCGEVILAIAFALALTDFVLLLFSPIGDRENPVFPSASLAGPVSLAGYVSTDSIGSRNLSPRVRGLFGYPESSPADPVFAEGPLKETALNLTLKGILIQRGTNRQLALISQEKSEEKVYGIGDFIAGAEIIRIERRRAILQHNNIQETLTLKVDQPRRSKASVLTADSKRSADISTDIEDVHIQ